MTWIGGTRGMDFRGLSPDPVPVQGEPTDRTVYDAAALSSVVELSIRSVRGGGKPQQVPDFTRGRWREWRPWPIVEE